MKYFIRTYGCQFNYSDSERIKTVLENAGIKSAKGFSDADVIIFNTCSVRQKAEDRIYGQMRNMQKLHKNKKSLLVGLTGCMVRKTSTKKSEKQDQLLSLMEGIDFVFRVTDTANLPDILREASPKIKLNQSTEEREGEIADYFKIQPSLDIPFHAFIPIMRGCNKFCTYCIVPYSRGREISRPISDILHEAEALIKKGATQITLLGQTVDSYGKDFKGFSRPPFVELLYRLDKLKGLQRLWYTSPHPEDMSDELISSHAALPTLMKHIHLPIQSGDDNVLKRMNRNYKIADYLKIINKIKKFVPGCSITTDIIVGFCGETDKEFENTLKTYNRIGWDGAYPAQYSPRKGTVSAMHMKDDVPAKVKHERWNRLNRLIRKKSYEYNKKLLGKVTDVLVKTQKKDIAEGETNEGKIITFKSKDRLKGKIVPVKITVSKEWVLEGEMLKTERK